MLTLIRECTYGGRAEVRLDLMRFLGVSIRLKLFL